MYASHLKGCRQVLNVKSSGQSSLVLAQNFLHSADLFFTHGGHHRQDHVLPLIKPTLDLQVQ
jgi:hypothetical protein